jgi:hypothetical protein
LPIGVLSITFLQTMIVQAFNKGDARHSLPNPISTLVCHRTPGLQGTSAVVFVEFPSHNSLQAWAFLYDFNKQDAAGLGRPYTSTPQAREKLRRAVLTVAHNSLPDVGWNVEEGHKELLIGVLGSDIRLAVRALRDWARALNVAFVQPESRVCLL